MLKLITISSILFITSCSLPDKKQKDNLNSISTLDSNSFKSKIDSAYLTWLENEILEGKIQKICPEYGSEEFQAFLEKDYDNENRFSYSKILKKLYADFNQDGEIDALYVLEKQDCAQGNGYVGDLQRGVVIISEDNSYKVDNRIIDKLTAAINAKAVKQFFVNVAYIEIQNVSNELIKGNYWDWVQGDPTGQPSLNKSFQYNFIQDEISISSIK
ncbi:MAG: hypothetical protein IE931_07235 [Sphingobacteriales bacterium]|nr:hypothetical protein [Sphingobacteriales bacterium]